MESSCGGSEFERIVAPPLDILVRTSDVHRLSDFLMWQVSPPPIPPILALTHLLLRCADIVGDFPSLRESPLAAVRATGDGPGIIGLAEGGPNAPVERLGGDVFRHDQPGYRGRYGDDASKGTGIQLPRRRRGAGGAQQSPRIHVLGRHIGKYDRSDLIPEDVAEVYQLFSFERMDNRRLRERWRPKSTPAQTLHRFTTASTTR